MPLSLLLAAISLFSSPTPQLPQEPPETPWETSVSSGSKASYCGVYCVYTLLASMGRPVDIVDLLKPRYLGSSAGSSLGELVRALTDHGLQALAVQNMTPTTLRTCPYPVILHVKGQSVSPHYNHYVLFLGVKDEKAQICDPPGAIRPVAFRELNPFWGGTGIIVSREPIALGRLFTPEATRFGAATVVLCGIVLIVRTGRRWLPLPNTLGLAFRAGLGCAQASLLALVSVSGSVICDLASGEGLLSTPDLLNRIEYDHFGRFMPKLDAAGARALVGSGAVFVDARHESDFELGHIQNAINIPPNRSPEDCGEALAAVSRDARIVIYCQSDGCPYAEKIARRIAQAGFTNLWHFKGGWREWEKGPAQ